MASSESLITCEICIHLFIGILRCVLIINESKKKKELHYKQSTTNTYKGEEKNIEKNIEKNYQNSYLSNSDSEKSLCDDNSAQNKEINENKEVLPYFHYNSKTLPEESTLISYKTSVDNLSDSSCDLDNIDESENIPDWLLSSCDISLYYEIEKKTKGFSSSESENLSISMLHAGLPGIQLIDSTLVIGVIMKQNSVNSYIWLNKMQYSNTYYDSSWRIMELVFCSTLNDDSIDLLNHGLPPRSLLEDMPILTKDCSNKQPVPHLALQCVITKNILYHIIISAKIGKIGAVFLYDIQQPNTKNSEENINSLINLYDIIVNSVIRNPCTSRAATLAELSIWLNKKIPNYCLDSVHYYTPNMKIKYTENDIDSDLLSEPENEMDIIFNKLSKTASSLSLIISHNDRGYLIPPAVQLFLTIFSETYKNKKEINLNIAQDSRAFCGAYNLSSFLPPEKIEYHDKEWILNYNILQTIPRLSKWPSPNSILTYDIIDKPLSLNCSEIDKFEVKLNENICYQDISQNFFNNSATVNSIHKTEELSEEQLDWRDYLNGKSIITCNINENENIDDISKLSINSNNENITPIKYSPKCLSSFNSEKSTLNKINIANSEKSNSIMFEKCDIEDRFYTRCLNSLQDQNDIGHFLSDISDPLPDKITETSQIGFSLSVLASQPQYFNHIDRPLEPRRINPPVPLGQIFLPPFDETAYRVLDRIRSLHNINLNEPKQFASTVKGVSFQLVDRLPSQYGASDVDRSVAHALRPFVLQSVKEMILPIASYLECKCRLMISAFVRPFLEQSLSFKNISSIGTLLKLSYYLANIDYDQPGETLQRYHEVLKCISSNTLGAEDLLPLVVAVSAVVILDHDLLGLLETTATPNSAWRFALGYKYTIEESEIFNKEKDSSEYENNLFLSRLYSGDTVVQGNLKSYYPEHEVSRVLIDRIINRYSFLSQINNESQEFKNNRFIYSNEGDNLSTSDEKQIGEILESQLSETESPSKSIDLSDELNIFMSEDIKSNIKNIILSKTIKDNIEIGKKILNNNDKIVKEELTSSVSNGNHLDIELDSIDKKLYNDLNIICSIKNESKNKENELSKNITQEKINFLKSNENYILSDTLNNNESENKINSDFFITSCDKLLNLNEKNQLDIKNFKFCSKPQDYNFNINVQNDLVFADDQNSFLTESENIEIPFTEEPFIKNNVINKEHNYNQNNIINFKYNKFNGSNDLYNKLKSLQYDFFDSFTQKECSSINDLDGTYYEPSETSVNFIANLIMAEIYDLHFEILADEAPIVYSTTMFQSALSAIMQYDKNSSV